MKKSSYKILIVEDELYLLNILCDKFRREGFKVIKATNGKVGMQNALKGKPDLILLDIIMPLVDGVTMIKHMRGDKRTLDIPIIIISNLSEVERITEVLGAKNGIIEYLVKSHWSLEGVVKKVKETIQLYNLLKQSSVKKV
jgi:two-component system, OmpR family, alkaline phosphatase synthesis response regulator PhoP